ncbi:MAG: tryptophan 7-halogenase [Acidobacteria bacterium]|nr:tryptophan 7-halogenase [Acidobacteriota bacterium]
MTWDAVVLGAGPSGCSAATALARRGRSVLLLDRDPEPRFKIGESLLPWNTPIFEELGLLEKIEGAGFQRKFGAFFTNERTGGTRQVDFRRAWDAARPSAWQVKRKDFDGILAAHAAESGATVRRGAAVEDVRFDGARATGVRVAGPGGPEEIAAKVVVDATGQAAFLASRLKIRRQDTKLRRAALYAHYTGVWRGEGERAGDILLPFRPDVWYWVIPFADGSASVGAVFDPSLLGSLAGKTNVERLEEILALSATMRGYLAGAARTSDVGSVSDYSFTATPHGGDGWVLAGDAATFLDPVFSTGVFLGMSAGLRAAKAIDAALAAKGRVDAADLKAYGRTNERMVARFRPFVYGYYDPVFTRMFCEEAPLDALRAAVTSTLAGDVESPSLGVRVFNRLTLMAFAFSRLVEKDDGVATTA